tara:strand:+ start:40 stop:357 length:318 start_codon:yes stop_codon:yes gene_type:complete
MGTIIKSGGTGKKKLSIKDTKPNKGFENLCLASSTLLSYNIFNIMNLKCTILKYLASLILSPIAVYAVLLLAKLFGANYELTHGESFLVWLLMAILINQSVTWKK